MRALGVLVAVWSVTACSKGKERPSDLAECMSICTDADSAHAHEQMTTAQEALRLALDRVSAVEVALEAYSRGDDGQVNELDVIMCELSDSREYESFDRDISDGRKVLGGAAVLVGAPSPTIEATVKRARLRVEGRMTRARPKGNNWTNADRKEWDAHCGLLRRELDSARNAVVAASERVRSLEDRGGTGAVRAGCVRVCTVQRARTPSAE